MAARTFGEALGALVYQKRKSMGLTQTQLSEDAYGTSAKTRRISELENGTVAEPHPKTIDPLIVVLRITEAELEECARITGYIPDANLDRAFREARNLINAAAARFEHSNPDAELSELEDFLRAKAKEWSELKLAIDKLEAPSKKVAELKAAAGIALNEGDFEAVDRMLREAEEFHQASETIEAIRRQAEIRITRGDSYLLRGDAAAALAHFIQAANFFKAFDEGEMLDTLEYLAQRAYETSKRSLDSHFEVAASLLELALQSSLAESNVEYTGGVNYRLSLAYRNMYVEQSNLEMLEKAISSARIAVSALERCGNVDGAISAKISLGNLLRDRSLFNGLLSDVEESIQLLKSVVEILENNPDLDISGYLGGAYKSLGSAFSCRNRILSSSVSIETLQDELKAFELAREACEKTALLEAWGAANINCANTLHMMARITDDSDRAGFLRIRAISACLAAIEAYPSLVMPTVLGEAQYSLGLILMDHGYLLEGQLRDVFFMRSINAFEVAATIYNEDKYPSRHANILKFVGGIFATHAMSAEVDVRAHDVGKAMDSYNKAIELFRKTNEKEEVINCENAIIKIKKFEANS